MPVKLIDLKRNQRTVSIPVSMGTNDDGEEVNEHLVVTYRPSAYTANAELNWNAKRDGDWKSEMGMQFVLDLVISWDLEDDDGVYPITKDALAELPTDFIGLIIGGIAGDMGKAGARSSDS